MEDLKKAYADVMLNTSKEAAAKIMAAERKAYRFRKEMIEAKEAAAQMMVRLKAMMDSKIIESETLSLNQRKKIEELEAQLHKAKDIENQLRTELKKVKQESDKHIKKGSSTSNGKTSQENKLITSESIFSYPRDSGSLALSSSNMKNVYIHQTHKINFRFSALEDVSMRTGFQNDSQDENYYADNPDLPSISRRMKESLHHKSGCIKETHASGRNQVNKKSSFPIHSSMQSSDRKNRAGNLGPIKKDAMPLGELLQKGKNWKKSQELNLFRVPCRKRGTRSRKTRTSLWSEQIMNAPFRTSLSHCETFQYQNGSITKAGEDPSKRIEETENEAMYSSTVSSFNTTNMDTKLEFDVDELTDVEAIKGKGIKRVINQKEGLIEVLVTEAKQDADEVNVKKVEVPLINGDIKDGEKCEMDIRAPIQTGDNEFLKFKFRRKRRKDENASQENTILTKRLTDRESTDLEPLKSSMAVESSPDDQQLMKVAHQLISLKGDRWQQI